MTWQEYEEEVYQYFKGRFPNATIRKDVKILGRKSEVERQIDILIEEQIVGHSVQIAIECKNWQSKLDVQDVESYITKLDDVGISKGVIISKEGYSETCYTRATKEIGLQLQVLDFENLPEFHHFYGVPYRGNLGAIISAPNGWLVDTKVPSQAIGNLLCFIHPFEFSSEESGKRQKLLYFQIMPKIESIITLDESGGDSIEEGITLEAILKEQNKNVMRNDPKAKIKSWNETKGEKEVVFREISYSDGDHIELTVGVEVKNIVAYCVGQLPLKYLPDDVARIRYVIESAVYIEMEGVDPENSHEEWKKFAHQS
jgi:hypothetical protein